MACLYVQLYRDINHHMQPQIVKSVKNYPVVHWNVLLMLRDR